MYKYSVVIPCYNDAAYVGFAVDSVLDQKAGDYDIEIVVVDDGTPNNSCFEAIKDRVDKGLVKFIKKENGGLSSARNAGVRQASGNYIVFLDADDLLASGYIYCLDCFLNSVESGRPDLVISSYKYFCDEDQFSGLVERKKYSLLPPLVYGKVINKVLISTGNCFPVSACAVSKDLFLRIGGFDESLSSLEDWDFWMRAIFSNCKVEYNTKFDNAYTLIRVRDGMMRNEERMKENLKVVLDKHQIPLVSYVLGNKLLFRLLRFVHALSYIFARLIFGVNTNLNSK